MSRLRRLLAVLGTAGVLGLGTLLFCVAFYVSALQPAEERLAARQAARLNKPSPRAVAEAHHLHEVRGFRALFPPTSRLPHELERVHSFAHASGVQLLQGEHRLEAGRLGLAEYHVELPISGSYAQIRGFLDALLRAMPGASLDAVEFERRNAPGAQLEARVRLTLYFRSAEETP